MAKYQQKRPRNNAPQKNKISNYFSPKTDTKLPKSLADSMEDLALTSPPAKRKKTRNASSSITPNKTNANEKFLTSPAKKISSMPPRNKIMNKASPRKSARNLFGMSPKSPYKRKRQELELISPPLDNLDMNANLSLKKEPQNPRKRKAIFNCEKFIQNCDLNTGSASNQEKNFVAQGEVGITKLKAEDCSSSEIPSKTMDNVGLSFFKEVSSYLQTSFYQPEKRLFVNFPVDVVDPEKVDDIEHGPSLSDRVEYSECLIAIMQAKDFSDTSLDIARNFLNHKPYLSWKFLRGAIYHTMFSESDINFSKAVKLLFEQLMLHPPKSSHMRQYYNMLLNFNDETSLGEMGQKGLLTYLMEVFSAHYQCHSNAKRTHRKNKRYLNDATNEFSDNDDDVKEVCKKSPKKKDKKESRDKPEEEDPTSAAMENINRIFYNALPSSQKEKDIDPNILLERQFELLDVVIHILEFDLVLWHQENSSCLREKLVSSEGGPIISMMWDRARGFSYISEHTKEIFYFYANSDRNHREYFERFIAVLAEVVRIFDSELVEEDEKEFIKFPNIGENCKNFSQKVFSHCFDKACIPSEDQSSTVDEQILRLKTLQPSWLKLLIANELLDQTLGSKFSGNLSSVVDVLIGYTYDDNTPCSQESLADSSEVEELSQTQRTKLRSTKDINEAINKMGETSLHVACKKRKHAEVRNFLQVPNIDVMVPDYNGWLPIHEAAYHGSLECCKLLYKHASTIESKSAMLASAGGNERSTPLLEAIKKKHIEVVEFLLSVGGPCLLKHVNSQQTSAFDLCSSEEIKQVLLKYADEPPKKYLRISPQVWDIMFALVSAYYETYGTEICFKVKLNLSPADFNNIVIPNENGNYVSFLLDSSLYINDMKIISQIQDLIKFLLQHNPDTSQLKLLNIIFS